MKIIEVDGEPTIIFPDAMIADLGLKEGDMLIAIPDEGGLKVAVDRGRNDQG